MAKNDKLVAQVNELYKLPETRDFLNMLAASEGTAGRGNDGYNIMFGGGAFTDYDTHPNVKNKYIDKTGKAGSSTAAGRYQILNPTYKSVADQLGITDFTPESQDKIAIALMVQKGAADSVKNGDVSTFIRKMNNTWTSLPGSTEGAKYHSQRDMGFIVGAFNASRRNRGQDPITVNWNNQMFNNTSAPLKTGQVQFPSFYQNALANSFFGPDNWAGRVMQSMQNKEYAMGGGMGVPFALSASPRLTPETADDIVNRLFNTNPNVSYGMADLNGLRPTTTITDPQTGTQRTLIQLADGRHIDLNSGELLAADGTPMVVDLSPTALPTAAQEDPNAGLNLPSAPIPAAPYEIEGGPLGTAPTVNDLGALRPDIVTAAVGASPSATPLSSDSAAPTVTAQDIIPAQLAVLDRVAAMGNTQNSAVDALAPTSADQIYANLINSVRIPNS